MQFVIILLAVRRLVSAKLEERRDIRHNYDKYWHNKYTGRGNG